MSDPRVESNSTRFSVSCTCMFVAIVLSAMSGCEDPFGGLFGTSTSQTTLTGDAALKTVQENRPTWTHRSEKAPYSLELSDEWSRHRPDSLNPHADLAVSQQDQLYLLVIPQPLPAFEGMSAPGAKALRAAGLRRMRENISKFRVENEGPVTVDGVDGVSALGEGLVASTLLQYVATFVTHDGWGYQIVAWGPAEHETQVIRQVDRALRGWQFRDTSVGSAAAPAGGTTPDAGTNVPQDAGR